jgi:hypothetical protein
VAGGFTPPFRGPEAESWRPHVERATRELFPGIPAINVLRDPGMTRQVEDLADLYRRSISRTEDPKVSQPGPLNPQKTNLSPEDIAAMDKIFLGQDDVAKMDKIFNAPKGSLNPIPAGAVPGSPGTNPDAPSWALPFAGQPQMSLREGGARVVGGLGAAATAPVTGPLGAASRIGVGAGAGAIRDGSQGAMIQGLINAIIEGGGPALGAVLRSLPGVRHALPVRPAVSNTEKTYSHSPWAGQTMQFPGPQPSPILNPAGQPARFSDPMPMPPTGPVHMTERTTTMPARPYMPNLPPMLRALLEAATNSSRGQRADEP